MLYSYNMERCHSLTSNNKAISNRCYGRWAGVLLRVSVECSRLFPPRLVQEISENESEREALAEAKRLKTYLGN